jgi:hypothetical protein
MKSQTQDPNKKAWTRPQLRSEEVDETLARPACQFKPPPGRGHGTPPPPGPAFS